MTFKFTHLIMRGLNDITKMMIKTVDCLLRRKKKEDMDLITYVTDCLGHDMHYAIDSTKLQKELAGNQVCSLKKVSKKTYGGIWTTRNGWTT